MNPVCQDITNFNFAQPVEVWLWRAANPACLPMCPIHLGRRSGLSTDHIGLHERDLRPCLVWTPDLPFVRLNHGKNGTKFAKVCTNFTLTNGGVSTQSTSTRWRCCYVNGVTTQAHHVPTHQSGLISPPVCHVRPFPLQDQSIRRNDHHH